jgi:hypothetical protein
MYHSLPLIGIIPINPYRKLITKFMPCNIITLTINAEIKKKKHTERERERERMIPTTGL